MLENKIQKKSNEINNWFKANNLKRDYSRELVSKQIVKNNQKGFTSYTETSYNTNKAYKITDNAIENIESISNNGEHLSALLKTERCTIENALQYQIYINQYLDDCKHKFGNFSKLSFEKLSEITENVLKEANNYGYKYYTKQK